MFSPLDDKYESKVRDSFSNQAFMNYIGAEMIRVEPGYCEIYLPYKQELSQHHGYFHGALIGSLADNAGGFAAFSLMPPDSGVLTTEYKINLLAPGKGDALLARGKVIKAGRTLTTSLAKVFVVHNNEEKLCAIALVSLILLAVENG